MKILYAYPYCGELGWELGNWLPRVYHEFISHEFDAVHAGTRVSREGLYRIFNPEITSVTKFEAFTECNAFLTHKPEAHDYFRELYAAADKAVLRLQLLGHTVTTIKLPRAAYRMFGFRNNEKAAITLKPDTAHRDKWSEIAGDAVVMHLRMLHRSPQKNTSQLSIDAVSEWCDHNGKKLIFVGNVNDKFHNECGINLTNSTTLDDLIAIYNCASFVIGSSSGPMHLAAYTKTPHIVWGGGSDNIRDRYTKHWNPHNTPCQFLTPMWYVKRDILHAAMTKFVAELSHA